RRRWPSSTSSRACFKSSLNETTAIAAFAVVMIRLLRAPARAYQCTDGAIVRRNLSTRRIFPPERTAPAVRNDHRAVLAYSEGLERLGDDPGSPHLGNLRRAKASVSQYLVAMLADVRRHPRRDFLCALDEDRRVDRAQVAIRERHDRFGFAHLRIIR